MHAVRLERQSTKKVFCNPAGRAYFEKEQSFEVAMIFMVGVAQLVECKIVALVVVGSIPIVHPIFFRYIAPCESGGIGRRAGFRFQWGNP